MGPASTTPRLRHLTQLRLDAACVGDDLLDEVAQLRELKLLVLWHAKVTDEGLSRLSDCRMLEELYLHDSPQVGEKGMAFLADHPRLTRLDLRYTAADDRCLPVLKGLTKLKELHLFGTKLIPATRGELKEALPNCEIYRP